MKFCIDCKHYKKGLYEDGYCMREPSLTPNLVTGEKKQRYCEIERRNYTTLEDHCGVDAVFFESK